MSCSIPFPLRGLRLRLAVLALAVLAAFSTTAIRAQTGSLDSTFSPVISRGTTLDATAIQTDGRMIIAGDFSTVDGAAHGGIARLNADGSVDSGFNANVSVRLVECLAVQADGKILIGGFFTTVNGTTGINRIARLNADGSLDTGFNADGTGASARVRGMALQADGKILICGDFTSVNGTSRNGVARLNTDGSLDSSFDNAAGSPSVMTVAVQEDGKILVGGFFGGIVRMQANGAVDPSFNGSGLASASAVRCISIQQDGKILIGGEFTSVNGTARNRIARLSPSGTLDTAFNTAGSGADGTVLSMAAQADGKIVVTGSFVTFSGVARRQIVRLNPDGTLDNGFVPSSLAGPSSSSVALQADGKILVGAGRSIRRLQNDAAPQILTAQGSSQVLWQRGGSAQEVTQVSFELSTDGGINFSPLPGTVTRFGGTAGWVLNGLSLPADGLLRARGRTIGGSGSGSSGLMETVVSIDAPTVSDIAPATGLAAGGSSVTITGSGFTGATSVTFDGTEAASFAVDSATQITAIIPAHAAGVVGVQVTSPGTTSAANPLFTYIAPPAVTFSTANLALDALSLTINGTGFSPIPSENVVTFTPGLIGTVTSATPTSLTVTGLAGLTTGALSAVVTSNGLSSGAPVQVATVIQPVPGTVDPSYNPNVTGGFIGVAATAVLPDGRTLIAGGFTNVAGEAHANIARLNADGSLDSTFNASTDDDVLCLFVQADGKILIGGDFTTVNGTTGLNRIARLNADGTLDSSFNVGGAGANNSVNCLALQADGKILMGGNFNAYNGVFGQTGVIRLTASGTLDTGFVVPIGSFGVVFSLAVQVDRKILIGGLGDRFARVNANGAVDSGFNNSGSGPDSAVRCVALQADGKILIAGDFANYNGTARRRLARINADGTLDTDFFDVRPVGNGTFDQPVKSIAVQTDGKVVLGGDFVQIDSTPVRAIARLTTDGRLDSTFLIGTGSNANSTVRSIALQANGRILFGGAGLTSFNGTLRNGFARLKNDPATQSLSPTSLSAVGWTRGGSSPEVSLVTFELSTDGGTSFTALPGTPTRVGTTSEWQLSGLSLPGAGFLRARGRTTGGEGNGSAGVVESVNSYSGLVLGNGVSIANGDTSPSLADHTDFGSVAVSGGTLNRTFTIANPGLTDLTPGSVTVSGGHAADFTVTAQPASVLGPLSLTNAGFETPTPLNPIGFVFAPVVTGWTFGSRTGVARNGSPLFVNAAPEGTQAAFIQNLNSAESAANRFSKTINLPATGVYVLRFAMVRRGDGKEANDIAVRMDGATLRTVSNTEQPDDVWREFTVSYNCTVVGDHTLEFAGTRAGGDFASAIDDVRIEHQTTTFQVTFDPSASGLRTATLSFTNNVSGENPVAFSIQGTGSGPEIAVTGNSVDIADGDTTPELSDHTDFGSVLAASGTVIRTFTVANSGNLPLTLGSVTFGGANAADFTVNAQPNSPVAPGGSTTFRITFDPSASGLRTATLSFTNDDPDEDPFTFSIQGTGSMPTIAPSTADHIVNATQLTINGTGFSTSPGQNTVVFSPGGSGTVTASTTTSLTVTDITGLTLGALNAVVTTNGVSSVGTAQVATVVPPGPDGLVFSTVTVSAGGLVFATVEQPDGKMIFAGNGVFDFGVDSRRRIARLNADGTLDSSFTSDVNGSVESVALQPDGKILICVDSDTDGIARLNADGSLDTTFDPPTPNDRILGVACQPDGKILINGIFSSFQITGEPSPTPRQGIARLNPDGTLDEAFDPNPNGIVFCLELQPDGKILLGGEFTTVRGVFRPGIARVSDDGFLDASFIADPLFLTSPRTNMSVQSLVLQPDGKILLGANFTILGGGSLNSLARVSDDGTLDTSFAANPNGSIIRSLSLQSDGKILVGGAFSTISGIPRSNIARLLENGTVDSSFNPQANSDVSSVAVLSNGQILLGGAFNTLQPTGYASPERQFSFARLVGESTSETLSIPDANQITWTRSGAGPALTQVLVQNSTDAGVTWTTLGLAARIGTSSDWQLDGLALTGGGQIRVLGRTSGGQFSGSQGLVAAVENYSFTAPEGSFPAWQADNFTPAELADPLISGSNANPDCDGLPNAVEFVIGTDPKGYDAEDILTQSTTASSPRFAIYTLRRLKGLIGVTMTLEVSSAPTSGFAVLGSAPVVTSINATQEDVTWTDDTALVPGSARYSTLTFDFGAGDTWSSETYGERAMGVRAAVGGASNGENFFANPYVGPRVFEGEISAVGAGTLTPTCAPTAGLFADGAYFLLLTSGPNTGTSTDIQSTSATLFTLLDDLRSLATAGGTFEVRRHASFDSLFGQPSQSGLLGGINATEADRVQLVGLTRARTTHFYDTGGSSWVDNNFDLVGDRVIMPEQGFIVKRHGVGDTTLYVKGTLLGTAFKVPVEVGDNLVSVPRDRALTLDELGLDTGDSATGLRGAQNAATADNLIVVNPNGTTTTYFFSTRAGQPGWRTVALADSGNVVIPAGNSFYIRRKLNAAFQWTLPSN